MRIPRVGRGNARAAWAAGVLAIALTVPAAASLTEGGDRAGARVRQPPPLVAEPVEPPGEMGDHGLQRLAAGATASAPFEHQVIEIVNEERLAVGLPPLKGNDLLTNAAEGHSERMAVADFFDHCDPDVPANANQFFERMSAAGYHWATAAENIAAGSSSPTGVMAQWMSSQGHRDNILDADGFGHREIGVGYFEQAGDQGNVRRDFNGDCVPDSSASGPFFRYWTQNFGRRNGVHPVIVEREAWETSCAEVELYTYGQGVFTQMRFSNDGATWSPWTAFSPDAQWTLPGGASGTATVWAQLGNGGVAQHQATDTIRLAADYPALSVLDLSADTVIGAESFVACDTLSAGDGFHVALGGTATFSARRVVLRDGFSVADGGELRVTTR
ncbi:MAG TPA: CAP domain-containing protein [Thermoanaerobaculia bacterium]|nr:CAP domain-containing protein [Thermoanaerobaculia bacterium]